MAVLCSRTPPMEPHSGKNWSDISVKNDEISIACANQQNIRWTAKTLICICSLQTNQAGEGPPKFSNNVLVCSKPICAGHFRETDGLGYPTFKKFEWRFHMNLCNMDIGFQIPFLICQEFEHFDPVVSARCFQAMEHTLCKPSKYIKIIQCLRVTG